MKKNDKFKCQYTSGGGTIYNEGEWIIKTLTELTLVIEKISESEVYDCYEKGDKLRCLRYCLKNYKKIPKHCLREWDDNDFTIYPDRGGTPFYFEQKI